ncbi:MAG: response regulator [Thermodesulfobacteriota bacterium]
MEKPRLLLVDDDIPFVTNLSRLLARRSYEVSMVYDGDSALRIVEEKEFDVIILDQNMPGKDGLTVLKELKKKWPSLEVIILTGVATVDSAYTGLQLGAYDYVAKPLQLSDLEEKIGLAFQKKLSINAGKG